MHINYTIRYNIKTQLGSEFKKTGEEKGKCKQ